jgi:hypothetical protein
MRLSPPEYVAIISGAAAGVAVEGLMAFSFFFAPGWANGWPGGLTIYVVWSAFMTMVFAAMGMTVGVGMGAFASLLLHAALGGRRAQRLFLIRVAIWALLVAIGCPWVYRQIHESTLAMWPNGYG